DETDFVPSAGNPSRFFSRDGPGESATVSVKRKRLSLSKSLPPPEGQGTGGAGCVGAVCGGGVSAGGVEWDSVNGQNSGYGGSGANGGRGAYGGSGGHGRGTGNAGNGVYSQSGVGTSGQGSMFDDDIPDEMLLHLDAPPPPTVNAPPTRPESHVGGAAPSFDSVIQQMEMLHK
ncbi:MAG: hypothetical protein SGPRY_010307, partial [Prymnesium sp.]